MTAKPPRSRFFVDQPLDEGAEIRLADDQLHHARSVLRLQPGRPVRVFNSRDGEWLGQVGSLERRRGRIEVQHRLRPPAPPLDFWMCFGVAKRGAVELIVEKATELGVGRLVPAVTTYSDPGRMNLDRLGTIALGATEQCERLGPPTIDPPRPLEEILSNWPADRRLLVAVEAGPAQPFSSGTSDMAGMHAGALVGPEGGFAPSELDALEELPFVSRVSLGPRVLRVETAAIAIMVCWQAMAGDWNDRPPFRAARGRQEPAVESPD